MGTAQEDTTVSPLGQKAREEGDKGVKDGALFSNSV